MKSISTAMRAHLNQSTTSLASCWRIVRNDGKVFTFTDHDQDLVVDGLTYEANGSFTRTAVQSSSDLSVDNLEITGFFSGNGIFENELRAGLFDNAAVFLFMVNWQDLTMGVINLRRGTIGQVILTKQGKYQAELRGMMQPLSQNIGETFSYNCRADLGDSRCKVPLTPEVAPRSTAVVVGQACRAYAAGTLVNAQGFPVDANGQPNSAAFLDRMFVCTVAGTTAPTMPVWDFTIGTTTADNGAVWECYEAWARSVTVASVDATGRVAIAVDWTNGRDSRSVGIDLYYAGGLLTWETGSNYPGPIEILQDAYATNTMVLYLPTSFLIQPGDRAVVTPGCQRTPQMCSVRYNNILNYRGEPFVPGLDFMVNTPGG